MRDFEPPAIAQPQNKRLKSIVEPLSYLLDHLFQINALRRGGKWRWQKDCISALAPDSGHSCPQQVPSISPIYSCSKVVRPPTLLRTGASNATRISLLHPGGMDENSPAFQSW